MTQTKVEAPFVENNAHFKNLVINGDMQIFQRATSATTIPASGYSTVDRFSFSEGSGGAATSELDNLSVADQATTGQARALELNCTSTDTSIAAGDRSYIVYNIEAQDCRRFLYGTSAAKTLTLSFWVKSNLTGNFPLTVKKDDNTVYYLPLSYSISSANTWEKKTITWTPTEGSTSLITASGAAINNDNGRGFQIFWGLMWGSNYTGSQSGTPTWTSTADFADSDITFVNFYSSTSNNLYITGVQLEVGDAASDFEHLPHDVQLQRCQRYYEKSYNLSVVPGTSTTYEGTTLAEVIADGTTTRIKMLDSKFIVRKRTAPTLTIYTSDGGASGEINNYSSGADKTISSIGNTSEMNLGRYMTMTDAGATNETYEFQYQADAEIG